MDFSIYVSRIATFQSFLRKISRRIESCLRHQSARSTRTIFALISLSFRYRNARWTLGRVSVSLNSQLTRSALPNFHGKLVMLSTTYILMCAREGEREKQYGIRELSDLITIESINVLRNQLGTHLI